MKKTIPQTKIAEVLGVSPAFVSQVLSGKVSVSWPLAVKLSELFPGKSLMQWKTASPDDIRRAFLYFEDVA